MISVDLKHLGRNAGSMVEYLRTRLSSQVKVKGSTVQLHVEHARDAKLILHKFFRQAGLTGYRVVVVHPGLVRGEAPEETGRRRPRLKEGATPSAWETVPDMWFLTPPHIRRPGKKSKRQIKRMMRGL